MVTSDVYTADTTDCAYIVHVCECMCVYFYEGEREICILGKSRCRGWVYSRDTESIIVLIRNVNLPSKSAEMNKKTLCPPSVLLPVSLGHSTTLLSVTPHKCLSPHLLLAACVQPCELHGIPDRIHFCRTSGGSTDGYLKILSKRSEKHP